MSASFTLVQYAKAIGPYSNLAAIPVTFPNPVSYGNLIVAFLGAYPVDGNWSTFPSSVTDSLGNTYALYSQSNTYADNLPTATFLWAATYIKGGAWEGLDLHQRLDLVVIIMLSITYCVSAVIALKAL